VVLLHLKGSFSLVRASSHHHDSCPRYCTVCTTYGTGATVFVCCVLMLSIWAHIKVETAAKRRIYNLPVSTYKYIILSQSNRDRSQSNRDRYQHIGINSMSASSSANRPTHSFLHIDINSHRAKLALSAAFVDATDSRYSWTSKDIRKLGGSEASRISDLIVTDHGEER